ncbi:MAG: hypothetical protein ACPLPV_04130 [Methanomassiliicoccales archaeon]
MGRRKKSDLIEQRVMENLQKPAAAFADSPAFKAFTDPSFATLPSSEAIDIGVALRALLEGQSITQSLIQQMNEEIARMKERMDKIEKARKAFEEDRKRFFEVTDEELERSRSKVDRDKVIAQVTKQIQEEVNNVRRSIETEQMRLVEQLKTEPKETITSNGEIVVIREGGSFVQKVEPEVVIIGNIPFVLPVGQPVAVPKSVAERWREMQRMKEIIRERQNALDASQGLKPLDEVAKKWQEIEDKSGIKGDQLPI